MAQWTQSPQSREAGAEITPWKSTSGRPPFDHYGNRTKRISVVLERHDGPAPCVSAAERRLSASISVNKITVLAAADELQAASTDATVWLTSNPCPDAKLRAHVAWMLNTCAEVALGRTARRHRSRSEHQGGDGPAAIPPDGLRLRLETLDAW